MILLNNMTEIRFSNRFLTEGKDKKPIVYKFEKIKEAKKFAIKNFPNEILIDMGVGEPDSMADERVISKLCIECKKHENRGYADNGCKEFRTSIAYYMKNVFGVELDEKSEILHSIGSKSALGILACCFVDPGDFVLMTVPGYQIFGTHSSYFGGQVYSLPLLEENNFLPDLEKIPLSVLLKTKTLVLNYPNNPTGANANAEFFEKSVWFAKKYNFAIIQDAAYAALSFSEEEPFQEENNFCSLKKPLSILQISGAKDVSVELHSLSKAFNMTGWRIGWVCGNREIVSKYGFVKNHTDSGQFLAIQKAGAEALANPEITIKTKEKYKRRLKKTIAVLEELGFEDVKMPGGGFFLYVKSPKFAIHKQKENFIAFENAESFSDWLIREAQIISVPWDEAGSFVRFSMTFDTSEIARQNLSKSKNILKPEHNFQNNYSNLSEIESESENILLKIFKDRLSNWTFKFN